MPKAAKLNRHFAMDRWFDILEPNLHEWWKPPFSITIPMLLAFKE